MCVTPMTVAKALREEGCWVSACADQGHVTFEFRTPNMGIALWCSLKRTGVSCPDMYICTSMRGKTYLYWLVEPTELDIKRIDWVDLESVALTKVFS